MIVMAIFISQIIPSGTLEIVNNQVVLTKAPKTMPLTDIVNAPIDSLIGISDGQTIKASNSGTPSGAINLVLLVLAIGSFVGVCTKVGVFDQLINVITTSNTSLSKITILLTIYFVVCATTFGLYESAVCYPPVLISLYKRYNVHPIYPIKLLILAVSVGYIASPINPFATLIADQSAGVTSSLFVYRSVMLVGLTISLIGYLLLDLRKYKIVDVRNDQVKSTVKLINIILFLIPYGYMTIGFIPNLLFNASMASVTIMFIATGLVIGLVNRLSLTETIDQLLGGINNFMIIAVSITLARTVYIILFNSQVIDPIIYQVVTIIDGHSNLMIIIGISLMYFILGTFIPSPSALAMITLPIITPALELVGISSSVTVTIFLTVHGLTKMYAITSPLVISSISEANVEYGRYIKSIYKYMIVVFVISLSGMLIVLI